jgi:hypothetical protein
MDVVMVGVQEVAMTHDKVDDGILPATIALLCVAGEVGWIAPEDVEDLAAIVIAGRNLAI